MSLPHVRSKIGQVRRRMRFLLSIKGVAKILLTLAILIIASFTVDYFLQLPLFLRVALAAGYGIIFLYVTYQHLLAPLLQRIDDETIALSLEKANPMLQDRLISALQFARLLESPDYHESRSMSESVIQEVEKLTPQINFFAILKVKETLRSWVAPLACLAIVALGAYQLPEQREIWLKRNLYLKDTSWPRNTNLFLVKEEFIIPANKKIVVNVDNSGVEEELKLWYRQQKEGFSFWQEAPLEVKNNKLQAEIGPFTHNAYFYLQSKERTFSSNAYYLRLANPGNNSHQQKISVVAKDFEFIRSRGERLSLRIFVQGDVPSLVRIFYNTSDQEWFEEPMGKQGENIFRYTFNTLRSGLSFYVQGGDDDDQRPLYQVQVLNPPTVEQVKLWYSYPDYTGQEDTPLSQPLLDGNIRVIEGTKVRLQVKSNTSIKEGRLAYPEKKEQILSPTKLTPINDEATLLETQLSTEINTRYAIELQGENGLSDPNPPSYYIYVEKDQAPFIQVLSPQAKYVSMLATGVFPIELQISDDFGLKEVTFLYRVNRSEEWQEIPFSLDNVEKDEKGVKASLSHTLKLSEVKAYDVFEGQRSQQARELQKGDTLSFKIKAQDNNNVSQPGIRESEIFTIEITDKTDLLRKLNEKLIDIKQQLAKVAELQQEKREYISDFLSVESQVEVSDLASILQVHFSQKSISRDVDILNQEVEKVLQLAGNNNLWDLYTRERINNVQSLLSQVAKQLPNRRGEYQGTSPQVEKHLIQAYQVLRENQQQGKELLNQAIAKQADILSDLREAIDLLGQWEDFNEVVRDLEEILQQSRENLEPMLRRAIEKE